MSWLQNDMYACGQAGLPEAFHCSGKLWTRDILFKHDFFACTGRYICPETKEQVVLKFNRVQPFMGIPLSWIGRFLRNRELKVLRKLQGLERVPQLVCEFGKCGFIYRFIEGRSLDEKPDLPNDFFDELDLLLNKVHKRNVCYLDMNKRGNILLGNDGHPYLIDFQISVYLPGSFWRPLRKALQKEDLYHLLKHKRRLRPDLLTARETGASERKSILIKIHRMLTVPLRQARRWFLRLLFRRNILSSDPNAQITPETDPERYK